MQALIVFFYLNQRLDDQQNILCNILCAPAWGGVPDGAVCSLFVDQRQRDPLCLCVSSTKISLCVFWDLMSAPERPPVCSSWWVLSAFSSQPHWEDPALLPGQLSFQLAWQDWLCCSITIRIREVICSMLEHMRQTLASDKFGLSESQACKLKYQLFFCNTSF